jgi:hypothetical protein
MTALTAFFATARCTFWAINAAAILATQAKKPSRTA